MSNPRFSLNDTAILLKHVRTAAVVESGLTVSAAYTIAEQMLEKLFNEKHPSPPPVKTRETPAPPRVPCTVHREKRHVFKDGSVMEACSHDGCLFGKGTKRHSNGMRAGIYAVDLDAIDEIDEDGVEDDPAELSIDGWASSAQCDAEDGIVPELPEVEITDCVEDCDEQSETTLEEVGRRECN